MEQLNRPELEPVSRAVHDAVAVSAVRGVSRLAVAFSGGRDSMVLLDAFALSAAALDIELSAVHVHHGLSPNADAWAQFCVDECSKRGVPLTVHRVRIERRAGASLEAAARAARYAALAAVEADIVALAHHADDQAETLLLQLLRGSGPQGLAAMPRARAPRTGPIWLRPLLALPRAAIDAYASARELAWVEDESNSNTGVKRNFIRHEIAPRLGAAFPGFPATLVRSAELQAEAAMLIDDLARLDAESAISDDPASGATLDRGALIGFARTAPHRARNLLRWFLRLHALSAPSAARLAEMLDQLTRAAHDARVRLVHDGAEIGFHRGRVLVHAPAAAPFEIPWRGELRIELPHGTLDLQPCVGAGVALRALQGCPVVVRGRSGGERIRLAPDRPARAVKHLMQEADIPAWERPSWPLVYCGEALAAVPGIGVDVAFQALGDIPGYALAWGRRSRRGDTAKIS